MRVWGSLCLAFSFVLHATGQRRAANPVDQPKIDAYIRDVMQIQKIPAMSISVVQNGKVLYEKAFGLADLEHGILATPNTPFYVASVTKNFTGASLILLHARHKLDLNKPVNDYLVSAKVHTPEWDVSGATVLRLVDHTAGLTTYERKCPIKELNCKVSTRTAIDRFGIVFWPPGDHEDYSNIGYGVLGQVISDVSNMSLSQFFQGDIFGPMAMRNCYLREDGTIRPDSAVNYPFGSQQQSPLVASDTPAASSVRCSSHDLAAWGSFLVGTSMSGMSGQEPILTYHQISTFLYTDGPSRGAKYSFGWDKNVIHGYRGVFAQGGTNDSFALLQLIPSQKLVLAVVSNTGTTVPFDVVSRLLSQVLPPGDVIESPPPPKPRPRGPNLSGTWTGAIDTWKDSVPLRLRIIDNHAVEVRLGTRAETPSRCSKPDISPIRIDCITQGNLHLPERPNAPYPIELELYLHGNQLFGAATTGNGAELPSWVHLSGKPNNTVRRKGYAH